MKDFAWIESEVVNWGYAKHIYSQSNPNKQVEKLGEEFIELVRSVADMDYVAMGEIDEIQDAIGDMMVVLTHIARMLRTDLTTCYFHAYNQIKDRKGKMVNGIFVKEE